MTTLAMTLEDIVVRPDGIELRLPDWSAWSVDVRPRHPVVVTCVEGCLLVTLEGDPADHVLAAGEALTAARRGRLVVAALGPSRARVRAA